MDYGEITGDLAFTVSDFPYVVDAAFPTYLRIGAGGNIPITNTKFNSQAVKVLWQKTVRLKDMNALWTIKYGKIKPKGLKGKKTFRYAYSADVDLAQGNVRQGNYYLICDMWALTNASASHNISLSYDFSIYYKDM